jgi:hypothetical protein
LLLLGGDLDPNDWPLVDVFIPVFLGASVLPVNIIGTLSTLPSLSQLLF